MKVIVLLAVLLCVASVSCQKKTKSLSDYSKDIFKFLFKNDPSDDTSLKKQNHPSKRFTRRAVSVFQSNESVGTMLSTPEMKQSSDQSETIKVLDHINLGEYINSNSTTADENEAENSTSMLKIVLSNQESESINDGNVTKMLLDSIEDVTDPNLNYNLTLLYNNGSSFDWNDNETIFWMLNNGTSNSTDSNFTAPIVLLKSDSQVSDSLTLFYLIFFTLFALAIISLLFLIFLVLWRRRGSHGVWIINENSFGKKQPILAAFENECFTMDSRLLGSYVLANNDVNQGSISGGNGKSDTSAKDRKATKPSKNSGHASSASAGNGYAGIDQEMMEMMEKSFEREKWRH